MSDFLTFLDVGGAVVSGIIVEYQQQGGWRQHRRRIVLSKIFTYPTGQQSTEPILTQFPRIIGSVARAMHVRSRCSGEVRVKGASRCRRAPQEGSAQRMSNQSPAPWEELKMSTKRGFCLTGAILCRLAAGMMAGLAVGIVHVAPAFADLQFTLDLGGCKIGCDVPGMQLSGTIVFQAADPGAENTEPNWQVAQIEVSDPEIAKMLSQLMPNNTVVQNYYSTPYLARDMDQKFYGVLPSSTGGRFTSELPLTSYAVGFIQPRPLSVATTNGGPLAPATVPEPTSLTLLGAGLAWLAFLRRRRPC